MRDNMLLLCTIIMAPLSICAMNYDQELLYASLKDNKQRVQALINAGANINAQNTWGRTALMLFSSKGDKNIVELLLKQRADVNAQTIWGTNALAYAVDSYSKDIAELLLKYNADVNAQDKEGWTALMRAIHNGRKDIVELLLKHDAQVAIKDTNNRTAFAMAKALYNNLESGRTMVSKLVSSLLGVEDWADIQRARYKEIGKMLLDALIKQERLAGAQRAGKRALLKQLEEHQHIPDDHKIPKEIIAMIFREIKKGLL